MATEKKNPRLLRRGDVVKLKGTDQVEVVRNVSVVLHMANGQDVVYDVLEEVEMAELEDVDPDDLAKAAAEDAKLRKVSKPATKSSKS